MKHSVLPFFGGVLATAFFTSCLSDVNTAFNPGVTPAVVQTEALSGLIVADTRYGTIYSDKLNSNTPGKCLLVEFTYNAADAENMNVQENGYYTVTLQNQTSVNQSELKTGLSEPTSLLPYEQPVLAPLVSGAEDWFVCLDDYLFLPSAYLTTLGQEVKWELAYDPAQSVVTVGDKQAYPLYLRAWATKGRGEEAVDTALVTLNAFNIQSLVETVRQQQESPSREGLYITLNYIKYINPQDSTDYEWATTEPLLIK